MLNRPLTIFVHRASECLTDHESHGDGLICFSLLNGLAERGHSIYAYTGTAPILECSPNLHVKTARHRVPANSLAGHEHAWRADQWLGQVAKTTPVDIVWRMHPYGAGCPIPPRTDGRPLVVGPLFYGWPAEPSRLGAPGSPRLRFGIGPWVRKLGERGWDRTLRAAALILCATEPHTEALRREYSQAHVETLPVIVEPPAAITGPRETPPPTDKLRLLFVANLVANKRPEVFCQTVLRLRERGLNVEGVVLGDGPERGALEAFCAKHGMKFAICFAGKVPNAEVYQHLRGAHFLVSTSFGEPYGRGIAESMAVGTPAVCHRSGGPADLIADGVDGLLVDELMGEAYANRICAMLERPEAWREYSEAARRKAQDWRSEAVLDRLESLLRSLTDNEKGEERQ